MNEFSRLYQNGMSLRDIGEKMNCSHETARRQIPKHLIRRQMHIDPATRAKILLYFRNNHSYQRTADKFGIADRTVVYKIIKRHMPQYFRRNK